jgi:hypothetical protein
MLTNTLGDLKQSVRAGRDAQAAKRRGCEKTIVRLRRSADA